MNLKPSTIPKFLIALLKHQARVWLGEEAAGLAAQTLIDEELRKRLDRWLNEEQTARALLQAAERARLYLQDPRHCPDDDLRRLFHSLDFGDLPAVQQALAELPQAMDTSAVTEALRADFDRTLPNLTVEQRELGARLWTEALLTAVGTLEEFTLPILRLTVQEDSKKLDQLLSGQDEIKVSQEEIKHLLESLDRRIINSSRSLEQRVEEALIFVNRQESSQNISPSFADKVRDKIFDRYLEVTFNDFKQQT